MAGVPNVVIRIAAETAGAVRDINQVNTALGDQVTAGSKATNALKKAAAPAAAAFAVAGGAIAKFTKAAAEDADSQAHLQSSLEATTHATEKQVKASEDYITSLSSATGVADDEMRPALEKLAAATHSTTKGQKDLTLAVDIAERAHTSLATATKAVVGAEQGRLGALNKLVPGIDAATIKNKDATAALEQASKLTGGAATDAAKTYGGQMKVMSNQVAEAEEAIGSAFLPVLDKLIPVLKRVADFVSDNTTAFSVLLGAVAAVAGIILVANAAMKAYEAVMIVVRVATTLWTGVQWLLNAALNANPIGLIVLAIVGAAGLIYALKKAYDSCDAFRDVVNTLWGVIRKGIELYLIPLKLEFEAVKAAIDLVQRLLASPFGLAVIGALTTAVEGLLGVVRKVAGALGRIASLSFDAVINAIKTVVDWISKIDFPSPPKWLSHIPGLGSLTAVAVPGVGARGVTPGVTASSDTLTINVWGAIDPEGTARQIRRLLDAHDRRQGRIQ